MGFFKKQTKPQPPKYSKNNLRWQYIKYKTLQHYHGTYSTLQRLREKEIFFYVTRLLPHINETYDTFIEADHLEGNNIFAKILVRDYILDETPLEMIFKDCLQIEIVDTLYTVQKTLTGKNFNTDRHSFRHDFIEYGSYDKDPTFPDAIKVYLNGGKNVPKYVLVDENGCFVSVDGSVGECFIKPRDLSKWNYILKKP